MVSGTRFWFARRYRGRLAFLSLGLAAAGVSGCGRETPAVMVRLDALAAQSQRVPTVAVPTTPSPVAMSGSRGLLEALPERRLFLGGNAIRLESALRAIEDNRQRAYTRVLERLQETFAFEAEQGARQLRIDLADQRRRELDQAYVDLRSVFELYAEMKGRLPWELASLVGFPDPDPGSTRPLTFPRSGRPNPRRVKAKSHRERIAEIDAQYAAARDALLARVESAVEERGAAVDHRIEQMIAESKVRAEEEARRLAASRRQATLGVRDVARDERLLAQPGASTAVQDMPPIPMPRLTPPSTKSIDGRAWDQALLVLWARSHGYRLAKPGEKARDATHEFSKWRAAYLLGP